MKAVYAMGAGNAAGCWLVVTGTVIPTAPAGGFAAFCGALAMAAEAESRSTRGGGRTRAGWINTALPCRSALPWMSCSQVQESYCLVLHPATLQDPSGALRMKPNATARDPIGLRANDHMQRRIVITKMHHCPHHCGDSELLAHSIGDWRSL